MRKPTPNEPIMSPKDFLKHAKRMSKYVDLRGCRTESCINRRIRRKNSRKLNYLIKAGFAFRLLIESWNNPHSIYKEMLDIYDDEYDILLEEKRKSDKRVSKLLKYIQIEKQYKKIY